MFKQKGHYIYHVYKRKRPCVAAKNQNRSFYDQKLHQKFPRLPQFFMCHKCNKTYSSKSNLNRHLRSYCPSKKKGQNNLGKKGLYFCSSKTNNHIHLNETKNSDNISSIDKTRNECNTSTKLHQNHQNDQVFFPDFPHKCGAKISRNGGSGEIYLTDFQKNSKNPSEIVNNDTFPNVVNCGDRDGQTFKTHNKCNYCLKSFSRSDSLTRHLKKRCNIKQLYDKEIESIYKSLVEQMEEQNRRIDKLEGENEILKSQLNSTHSTNIINNGIVNNTIMNCNFNVVAFGTEDLSQLSEPVCRHILNKGFQAVSKLIEYIHFNINNPKFHNIFIPNMRDIYAMIFDGSNWNLSNKKDVIDQLFEEKKFFLETKYYKILESLDDITKRKFSRFLDEQDNSNVINVLKNDIKLILYNKRDIPIRTKKFMDKKEKLLLDQQLSNINLIEKEI